MGGGRAVAAVHHGHAEFGVVGAWMGGFEESDAGYHVW